MTKITFIVHELLTWQAILDIILIAVALFFLYRTLVRLGTWKILLGILAAFAVFSVASVLNLEGITWIFQNVSQVAAIALIVIFQPELRKLLEKVVTLQKRKSAGDSGQIETVAQSLWQLAKQHRGAIIVYPGREPVQEKLSGGHLLAAEPSVPLIVSIFDPNSPGHDGAMIIEGNRLTSFGVRLPMSQTSRLPEEYGTRHHAAMGLAEQTDALVLVVSEERGVVSAFRDGTMRPLGSAAEVAAAIVDHTQRTGSLAVEQLGLLERRTAIPVVASLVVATIFWTTLASVNREVVVKSLSVPLEYIPPAEGFQLIGERPEEVRVQLAGPKSEIDNFASSQPTVEVDLSGMVEGKQTILITRDQLQLPERLSILDVKPAQIVVNLAEMIKKTVPIIPQLLGSLPQGLKLKQVKVIPNELAILMPPPKKGDKPPTVSTTPVYLNSVAEESRILCKIIAPPTIQPAVKPWQDVEVIIEVSENGK
ncbi:MAG: hypothetical protein A2X81_05290 [Desulfobacterales bacterium GWB2_56_26]|nr:MAG: hypothetical protein A2X81_05290 [Desulfobacterales bacterium GWB2_56_26]